MLQTTSGILRSVHLLYQSSQRIRWDRKAKYASIQYDKEENISISSFIITTLIASTSQQNSLLRNNQLAGHGGTLL